jgi:hypothetical protein
MTHSTPIPTSEEALLEEELEIWRLRFTVPTWLRDNPGLVLTGAYVLASLIGMAYIFHFFRRFRINVLEFTEVSDFLVVVVREPATIALALSSIPLYWIYMRTTMPWMQRVQRRWPKLQGSLARRQQKLVMARRMAPYVQAGFIIVYAMLFMLLYSGYQASRVRDGRFPVVTVEYKTDAAPTTGPVTATLLGTTSRFLFVYRPETRRAEAIPFDAIARLSWDARSRREREADGQLPSAQPGNTPR